MVRSLWFRVCGYHLVYPGKNAAKNKISCQVGIGGATSYNSEVHRLPGLSRSCSPFSCKQTRSDQTYSLLCDRVELVELVAPKARAMFRQVATPTSVSFEACLTASPRSDVPLGVHAVVSLETRVRVVVLLVLE